MLMTMIQKEVMQHILSVRFYRALVDVSPTHPAYPFY